MKKYRLGDIAKVDISGIDKKSKEGETAVRLCNFTDVYYNWAITKNMYNGLMEATASESDIESFLLQKGMVAITKDSETRDDIGIAAYIADDFDDVVLGYHCALIVPKEDTPEEERIYGKYLNALLHTKYAQKYFYNNATGSGQRYTLSKESIEDIPVYLPSFQEQVRIGDYLSDIDKKIEVNNLINSELEAMAKQIYDYWFVQFDFPNEDGKPYKSSGGKMVWNETLKREIPEGWEVLNIFDATNVLYGYPFSTDCFVDEPTNKPVVRIRDILDNTSSAYTTENVDDIYRLKEGDLVIGMDGNFHMNYWHNNKCYLNQRCVRFRDIPEIPLSTIQLYFNIKPILDHKQGLIQGSTVGHLLDSDIKEFWIICPPQNMRKHIKTQFDNILKSITGNKQEIMMLDNLRNYLLPLLMNGQITIKD